GAQDPGTSDEQVGVGRRGGRLQPLQEAPSCPHFPSVPSCTLPRSPPPPRPLPCPGRGGRSRLPDPVTADELFAACAADPSAHAGRELTVTGVATGGRDLGAPGRPPHLLVRGPGPRQAVRCLFVPGTDLDGVRFGSRVSVRGTFAGPSTDARLQGAELV